MNELANTTGTIFNVQTYSIHDGPGIRTTVFLTGCPLRCLWCQNPESQKTQPQLFFTKEKCTGCGKCLPSCPVGAITIEAGSAKTDRKLCNACGKCVEGCLNEARCIMGRSVQAQEVLEDVLRDRIFYEGSGGGVTLSGGEPLAQAAFSESVFKLCKEEGIHTAIETCGYAPWETVKKVLANVDLVLFDIKHLNSEQHKKCTGVPNELILENIKRIHHELALPIIVRIPIIPGYNDSKDNIRETAKFVANELSTSVKINILPFHKLGESKNERLEQQVTGFSSTPPANEYMEELKRIIEGFGIEAKIGG